jgi:thiol:disulfide interchange protein DsbD
MRTIRFFWLLIFCLAAPLTQAGMFDNVFGSSKPTFLPVDQAFGLEVSVQDDRTLLARFRVTPDYYIYREKILFSTAEDSGVSVAEVLMPQGELKHDTNFEGKEEQEVFHESFEATIHLERSVKTAQDIVVYAVYQGCSEKGLCYPPVRKNFNLALPALTSDAPPVATPNNNTAPPAAATNENSRIANLLKQGNFWLILSGFFGMGLLLAFTPCMFPMFPILSSIIVGHGEKITHARGFALSLAYVQGMAVSYAAVGIAAGLTGTLLSTALQTPWALGAATLLFIALALSMFGLYELQLPSALQSRLSNASNKLHGGHFTSVFGMGALSAIIVSPCVSPALGGALMYIGQSGDWKLGGAALYVLAIGMGIPLLLIGASAGTLLPKAGAWMESVKRFFGVLMLAVALWIISPLLPVSATMVFIAALLIVPAIFLNALDALPLNATMWRKIRKGLGILMLLIGAAYLAGALSGARDLLNPLGAFGGGAQTATSHLPFQRIKTSAELDARIAAANDRPVMLDYYADWCVSCKEMERFTFSDSRVQARLKDVILLQADVTKMDDADSALLKRFNIYGPPATLFFDKQGREQSDLRVMGYENAATFLQSLQNAGL